ncbi:hypothetical protein FOA52_001314 [Chlamydomonas sp. UWO 241]|nr:hypothetical protein FOA52_001314 [Chlamydomonas sp. UWO 241]
MQPCMACTSGHSCRSGIGDEAPTTTCTITVNSSSASGRTRPLPGLLAAASAASALVASALLPQAAGALEVLSDTQDPDVAAKAAEIAAALAAGTYTPSSMGGPGDEVWIGFIAGVIPFAIGSWEFGKRILIQQRCTVCAGKGLVPSSKEGTKYVRKCPQCGGFFPWVSWKLFLTSTAAPGNGGPLQYPKGQTSVFFKVPPKPVSMPDLPDKALADKETQQLESESSKAP